MKNWGYWELGGEGGTWWTEKKAAWIVMNLIIYCLYGILLG